VMSFTYIRFNSAMKAQGVVKSEYMPVTSKLLPYGAYWALFWSLVFILAQGYAVFLDGKWDVPTFIFNYGIVSDIPDPSSLSCHLD
jgi:amino acid transporter